MSWLVGYRELALARLYLLRLEKLANRLEADIHGVLVPNPDPLMT